MSALRSVVVLAALALAAAGCSPKGAGGQAAGGSSAGAAAPASGPDVTITKADLPRLKAGQWQSVETENGGPPQTSTHCDAGKPFDPTTLAQACSQVSLKKSFLGAIVIDMTCGNDKMTLQSHLVAAGDFNSALTVDTTLTETAAGQPPVKTTSHNEMKYLGACPAGQE